MRVGERADSDFVGLGLTRSEAYTRLDARLRLRVAGPVEAFVAGENLLDAEYQEVLGYPALGRSRPRRPAPRARRAATGALAGARLPPRARSRGAPRRRPAARGARARVASLNLTADELLVEMLPADRLVAVTRWADDATCRTWPAGCRPRP